MSIAEEFRGIPTGNVCDANNKTGAMKSYMRAVYPRAALAGPAFTVRCFPKDNLSIHIAIEKAPAGCVLVVDAGGFTEAGHFGEIMATACRERGIIGLVIDGGCRDAEDLEEMDFPVFCRSLNPGGTVKDNHGDTGKPVTCGGVTVNTGDIIVADRDGVVVVKKENASEVLQKALAIRSREVEIKKELKRGKTTCEIYQFPKLKELAL